MKPADILAALLVVLIWGFNFVVIKIGLQGLPPILFSSLRFLFAALPLVFFVRRPPVPWKLLGAYACFQFALQFTLLFSGMKLGFPPGLASLVIQLQAFFTIGLAVLVLGERPLATQLLGALIAFAGMGLVPRRRGVEAFGRPLEGDCGVANARDSTRYRSALRLALASDHLGGTLHLPCDGVLVASQLDAQSTVHGFLLVIAAGFSWGIGNIFTKRIGKVDALALVCWGSLLAAPPLLLVSLLVEGPDAIAAALAHFGWRSAGAVLFQAYPTTVVGFGIWSLLMRKYPTATIAPFTLLVPVAGMVSAALVLDEPLQWWKLAAGFLVLAGLALNQFGARLLGARGESK